MVISILGRNESCTVPDPVSKMSKDTWECLRACLSLEITVQHSHIFIIACKDNRGLPELFPKVATVMKHPS